MNKNGATLQIGTNMGGGSLYFDGCYDLMFIYVMVILMHHQNLEKQIVQLENGKLKLLQV